MAMHDIETIARLYSAHGLSVPPGLSYAVTHWRAVQEHVNTPIEDTLAAGLLGQTFEVQDTLNAFDETTLGRLVKDARGPAMQDVEAYCNRIARTAIAEDYGRVIKELQDRFVEAAATVVAGLEHFQAEDFTNPAKVHTSESASIAWFAAKRSLETLDSVRTLVVNIDSQAVNSVSFFIDLGADATPDTLPLASNVYHQHQSDMWVRLFGITGVKPELHDRDGAVVVSRRAAELQAAAPKPKKMPGQW